MASTTMASTTTPGTTASTEGWSELLRPNETSTKQEAALLGCFGVSSSCLVNDGLMSPVSDSGENFSAGQRQLMCFARALLRKSNIIVMDEATASVDSSTDEKLQKMIRERFVDQTLICIAHRLDTILDSDRVCVMDDGKVVEYDTPSVLLNNPASVFSGLVQEMQNRERGV
jgi:ABC-type multidrug transport system fused ATPase/permease subunit